MTLDQRELRKLVGAPFYEERLLMLLIRLRNPQAHVVYVTSQPVHPLILDYYLALLMGAVASVTVLVVVGAGRLVARAGPTELRDL